MNVKKVSIFIGITFFLSWLLIYIFHFLGGKWNTPTSAIVGAAVMLFPMISALIVQKGIYGQDVKIPLGISFKINKFWFLAWFLPLFIVAGTFFVGLLIPGVHISSDLSGFLDRYKDILPPEQIEQARLKIANSKFHPLWMVLGQASLGFFAGISINAVFAFGEELGWRGFLANELKEKNFWVSSWIIGFIWGIWHFPIILMGHNYPQHPQIGVLMMIFFCMLLAPVFTYIRRQAKSVLAAAILHGTINGTAGLPIMLLKGGNDLTVGITGLSGLIALLFVNILIYLLKGKPDLETN